MSDEVLQPLTSPAAAAAAERPGNSLNTSLLGPSFVSTVTTTVAAATPKAKEAAFQVLAADTATSSSCRGFADSF